MITVDRMQIEHSINHDHGWHAADQHGGGITTDASRRRR
jgi:hypothetical protein